jgi:rod shape-determining protein MreD
MRILNPILILAAALLVVFLQARWNLPRLWLSVQIDFLPGLMVYAGLSAGLATITLAAVTGGLCFDSLSANPAGVSVLPLFVIGLVVQNYRHLILSDQTYAQWVLGLAASAAAPLLSLVMLKTLGKDPILGPGSLWQWLIACLGGAALTPVYFRMFGRLGRALSYRPYHETSFRPDREIARGRH